MRVDIAKRHMRTLRYAVQTFFLLLSISIGYQFYQFVAQLAAGGRLFVQRPPSVDAFLPIAGLMSFKYFLFTGNIEPFHPAALVMFAAIVGVSLAMKKGFCGWICPVGTISQVLWMTGERIFGRNLRMEKYTDASLRSVKYIVMALFLLLIGVAMAPNMMVLFFVTDYYKTADVRTMEFFTRMSSTAFWVLLSIGGLSIAYKNFWCRYLCPYGALLGLFSRISPVKIRRNRESCTHCGVCSSSCPSLIDVQKQDVVNSAECFSCLTCISRCPSEGALELTLKKGKTRRAFRPFLYPAILLLLFYLVIGAGMLSGQWHSKMPSDEYARIIHDASMR
jgi:polyferredoxin